MRASVAAAWGPISDWLEGTCTWMYLDRLGKVTTAVGNLIDTVGAAQSLPWKRPDGADASRAEISAEWHYVKGRQDMAPDGGGHFAKVTTLRLTDDAVQRIMLSTLKSFEASIRARFPAYETWPADAQLGVLSMAWAGGPNVFAKFPTFSAAVRREDFLTASHECELGGVGVENRNFMNAVCFQHAAACLAEGGDPSVLRWKRNGGSPSGGGGGVASSSSSSSSSSSAPSSAGKYALGALAVLAVGAAAWKYGPAFVPVAYAQTEFANPSRVPRYVPPPPAELGDAELAAEGRRLAFTLGEHEVRRHVGAKEMRGILARIIAVQREASARGAAVSTRVQRMIHMGAREGRAEGLAIYNDVTAQRLGAAIDYPAQLDARGVEIGRAQFREEMRPRRNANEIRKVRLATSALLMEAEKMGLYERAQKAIKRGRARAEAEAAGTFRRDS